MRIDDSTGRPDSNGVPSNQWHPRLAVGNAEIDVVWQDNRLGDNDIWLARSTDGGATFDRAEPLAEGKGEQTRPDIAIDESDPHGPTRYVVWENDSDGTGLIELAARKIGRRQP